MDDVLNSLTVEELTELSNMISTGELIRIVNNQGWQQLIKTYREMRGQINLQCNWRDCYMKAGTLKEKLLDVKDDVPIFYQRIEDHYFTKGSGWLENAIRIDTDGHPENDDQGSYYIQAFSGFYIKRKNIFVLEAHY